MSKSQKKLVVRKLSTNFREAVRIETAEICKPKEGEICIKNKYVNINADDINFSKGSKYFVTESVPFGIGFEGIGDVVAVGEGVTDIKVGDKFTYINFLGNAYAEFTCVPAKDTYRVPEVKPEYCALEDSGLISIIGVEKYGKLKEGEKVLITAAAGGIGHMAVQLAKLSGCYVIGTCSSAEKEKFLLELGCDYTINYKTEDLGDVLSKDFPETLDVIFDTVGGSVLESCLPYLADKGRVLLMGNISEYKQESQDVFSKTTPSSLKEIIYFKGASVIGGNVDIYKDCLAEYYQKLLDLYAEGKIRPVYCSNDGQKEFVGMEGIIDAVEYLYKRQHMGKIVARIY